MGSPPSLFGHLKNGSFLIFSKTWCTGSRNIVLTIWGMVDPNCLAKFLWGRLLLYRSNLKSLLSWGITLTFLVKVLLKPCSVSRQTLKVHMATSSKSPSISLNISQYLFEYVFKVSPSRMVIDSKESKGRGTLLHVIKQDPNTRVSSLKELIKPAPRPSNHLIATCPRLDGNTLHIKASFLEWIAILWMKWLTCCTGSVRPLYMVNVGWANR